MLLKLLLLLSLVIKIALATHKWIVIVEHLILLIEELLCHKILEVALIKGLARINSRTLIRNVMIWWQESLIHHPILLQRWKQPKLIEILLLVLLSLIVLQDLIDFRQTWCSLAAIAKLLLRSSIILIITLIERILLSIYWIHLIY